MPSNFFESVVGDILSIYAHKSLLGTENELLFYTLSKCKKFAWFCEKNRNLFYYLK